VDSELFNVHEGSAGSECGHCERNAVVWFLEIIFYESLLYGSNYNFHELIIGSDCCVV
jgi:hypothetical protein